MTDPTMADDYFETGLAVALFLYLAVMIIIQSLLWSGAFSFGCVLSWFAVLIGQGHAGAVRMLFLDGDGRGGSFPHSRPTGNVETGQRRKIAQVVAHDVGDQRSIALRRRWGKSGGRLTVSWKGAIPQKVEMRASVATWSSRTSSERRKSNCSRGKCASARRTCSP
jgi:hypothetical protein